MTGGQIGTGLNQNARTRFAVLAGGNALCAVREKKSSKVANMRIAVDGRTAAVD